MKSIKLLQESPNLLAKHYSDFQVEDRILLSGHSHQAWPDIAKTAMMEAYFDAAKHVDDKWSLALQKSNIVVEGFKKRMVDTTGLYTLGASTHDLMTRLMSALPWKTRPRVVTTDGEFHSMRRQFDRLAEENIEIDRISSSPVQSLASRLAEQISDTTALCFVSKVMYQDASIVGGLAELALACQKHGCILVVDVYHAINVISFDIQTEGLENSYLVGGGYKYCQLGEGNAFLRRPKHCQLRPVITGWFAEFGNLEKSPHEKVAYPQGGSRFAGATYDPVSQYRGAGVFAFLDEQGLSVEILQKINRWQKEQLHQSITALDLSPDLLTLSDLENHAGFVALRSPWANAICLSLKEHGVLSDSRGDYLRLGPAPYVSASQLEQAVATLDEVLQNIEPHRQ